MQQGGSHGSSSDTAPSMGGGDYKYGRFDHTALHIAHALNATRIQKSYFKTVDKSIDSYLVSYVLNNSYQDLSSARALRMRIH